LNLEADMAARIEPDAASDSKRETCEVEIVIAGGVRGANAGHDKRPRPSGPIVDEIFVAEVSMKLIEDEALARRLKVDVVRVNM